VLERFVRHDRPKIRSADADIDHITNALAGMALPGATAQPIGKSRHPFKNGVDIGDHVAAVMNDGRAVRRTQRDMKCGTVLRDINLVASEHGIDAIP
jgi:hypothetical protein